MKIRGTAMHIAEKYISLARDAHSSGDSVAAENYLQHAEHYNRIILAAQAQNPWRDGPAGQHEGGGGRFGQGEPFQRDQDGDSMRGTRKISSPQQRNYQEQPQPYKQNQQERHQPERPVYNQNQPQPFIPQNAFPQFSRSCSRCGPQRMARRLSLARAFPPSPEGARRDAAAAAR